MLSYPAGAGSAHHGPCAVPVAAISSYLLAYRAQRPRGHVHGPGAARGTGRGRVAQLTPHLVDGSGHFIPAARDRLRAALAAARDGDTAEAARLLGEAEALTPPLTPCPGTRSRTHRRHQPAHRPLRLHRGPGRLPGQRRARRSWMPATANGTGSAPISPPTRRSASTPPRTSQQHRPASRMTAGSRPPGKSRQAKAALESGDYEQALALIDEAELLYPDTGSPSAPPGTRSAAR